jgi:C1A family cysteine protease
MNFGWKKSSGPLNVPEFKVSGTLIKLGAASSSEHIITEYTPISNQGSIGSCAANAGADMWEILYGLEHPGHFIQLSRLFLYWNARLYTQDTGKDDGTYIHNVMDSLTKMGVCLESTWPYDTSKVFAQPNQIAYKQGDDNTFNNYYQIISYDNDRLGDIESAIRANHPVIFGTQVGQELMDYTGDPNKVFNFPKVSKGGHAMLITGVRTNTQGKKEFYIRNSWGIGWGINGHAWFSSDYIENDDTSDIFVGTLMPDLLV